MKLFYFIAFTGLITACHYEQEKEAGTLDWLEGKWINQSDTSLTSHEQWEKTGGMSYSGFGVTIEDGDTLFYEILAITYEHGKFHYTANVGDGPVRFKLDEINDSTWVFVNPSHDFPTKITYSHTIKNGESWLIATAEGQGKKFPFRFKKAIQ